MKSTKKSLLLSTLSLMMCVAMLLGTTYAWFTDSVTSGKNKIQAGNLDVELEYSTDMSAWNTVGEDTDLFEDCLWEPGYTQVVYLKVKNVGTLALQYKLGINIFKETEGKNVAGETFKLSDYIKFGTKTDVTEKYATRDAARADVAANAKILSEGYSYSGYMAKGAADNIVALVVYMPEEVDNVANYRATKPEIELGVEVLATQWTKEADSFDDQYDKDATYPPSKKPEDIPEKAPVEYDTVNKIATINTVEGYQQFINGENNGFDVVLGGDINFGGAEIEPMVLKSLDGKGYSIKNAVSKKGGLFAEYNESLFIQNLTLENITVTAEANNGFGAGVVAARIRNGSTVKNITIKNCSIDSTAAKNSYAGALCGTLQCIAVDGVKAENCTVKGKNAGGLVGYACDENGGDTEVMNSTVTGGSVTTTATDRRTTGTIVGRFNHAGTSRTAVTNCSANGVTINNEYDPEVRLVGDTAGTTIIIDGVNTVIGTTK